MAGGAAHADDDVPAGGGAGVFDQVADDLGAVVPGGFVAEGGGGAGQGEIVINGLGDVGDLDFAEALLGDVAGGKGGVVAADADEGGDAEFFEHGEDVLHLFGGLGGIGAGGAEDGAAFHVDVLDVANGEGLDLGGVTLGDVFEAVTKADDFITLVDAFDGGGGNDAVQSGRRTTTNENA